ncbi:MAG: glutamate-5-semialdehyde dehydrogenase [Alphaproteobacteria bacterium]
MSSNSQNLIESIAKDSRIAMRHLAKAGGKARAKALTHIADLLENNSAAILEANAQDMAAGIEKRLSKSALDRLALDPARVTAMAAGVRMIAKMDDPVGKILSKWQRPNGLDIERVATPLGVIGVIFESRPNVTVDAAALCLKSGNAVILRGGSDSINSAIAIGDLIQEGLKQAGLDPNSVQIIKDTDRALVGAMLEAYGLIDVIVPRGGKSLTQRVITQAKVPVLAHLDGIVHLYVHEKADIDKALDIVVNAKMRRTGICGAAECLLVDRAIANKFLPLIADQLTKLGCELRGDKASLAIVPSLNAATDADYGNEFLDAILAIKIVDGVDAAITFIDQHGSDHTDAIITEDQAAADYFFENIDSAIVVHNASTQFADGGEFGMGAEIGIATGRLHARGPIGINQLCCFQYRVRGDGQCRPS